MSDNAPEPAPPRFAALLLRTAKRLGSSALPFVVVILLWQFASLFFPRFLFPFGNRVKSAHVPLQTIEFFFTDDVGGQIGFT